MYLQTSARIGLRTFDQTGLIYLIQKAVKNFKIF